MFSPLGSVVPSTEGLLKGPMREPSLGEKSELSHAWVLSKNLAGSLGYSRHSLVSRTYREEKVERSKQALGLRLASSSVVEALASKPDSLSSVHKLTEELGMGQVFQHLLWESCL